MFFKKKKGKTPKTSNRKVVPNMKPIEELRTNKDVAEWCRDFLRITDELSPELAIAGHPSQLPQSEPDLPSHRL